MRTHTIDFNVVYNATGADGKKITVNESILTSEDATEFVNSHGVKVSSATIYKSLEPLKFRIDEPVVKLTRKANEMVSELATPIIWEIVVHRTDPVKRRGTYKRRPKYARITTN